MIKFYTYLHRRESDNSIFYVGKGQRRRAWITRRKSNPHWMNTVAKHGFKVEICAEWPTEAEAFEHEKFLIECFRDMGYALCNMTDGGEGASGLKHPPRSAETRAKLSAANKGKTSGNKGNTYSHSAETRARMSAAKKGRKVSAETRAKMSAIWWSKNS